MELDQELLDHELELHELLDHELLDQELPDHELEDHELADQELPDQELELHELADQELPDHELPDQELRFQTPPDHDEAAASRVAIADASNCTPKMSRSPWSVTPLFTTWTEPRDSSSEPVPVEGASPWGEFVCVAVDSAAFRLSSPAP